LMHQRQCSGLIFQILQFALTARTGTFALALVFAFMSHIWNIIPVRYLLADFLKYWKLLFR